MMTLVGADLIARHLHLIGLRFLVFQIGGSLRLTVGCCHRLMLLVLVFMLLLVSCLISGIGAHWIARNMAKMTISNNMLNIS